LFLADTHAPINKAVDAIKMYREKDEHRQFVVIIDEADAMYRTPDRSQKMEHAYEKLMALNPSLKTRLPWFLSYSFLKNKVKGTYAC
jgi:predicted patatin/cPLA2 family phospholipase